MAVTDNNQVTSSMEQLEVNKIKLTINVSPELLRKGLTHAYNRNKQYFNIPGFRKGKATRRVIEQMYGRDVFFDDAINHILPEAYESTLDQLAIDPVYKPEIEPGDMNEKDGAVFVATVYTRPEAEVDGYYGLTYPKGEPEATEADIQSALEAEQKKNARQVSVDRPAALEDIATINFTGYIDGEAFDGGEGKDHDLTLGSGQFIPGFEEQLVGHVPGDDVSVKVTFPTEYHAPEFAGKEAVFEVEILDVKANELPEIDDEFAQDVSEFDTLEAFRNDLAEKITETKKANLENNKRSSVMRKLTAATKVDVPEAMYFARLDDMMNDFSRQIESRGMDIENYMRFTQLTEQALKAQWRPQAEEDVKGVLALTAVAKKENFTISDEEFSTKLGEMLNQEGEALKKFIADMHPSRRRDIERSILCEKALDFVMEKAVPSDEPMEMELNLNEDVE
ncbi:MAG: trigger factor [Defluviitaleaceae bacterium]|nr:trigger factor [Defluviitaleaceae bacterium]